MNKKLVAIAVAGMLAAPLAAEAQTANVTLYGRLNYTVEAVRADVLDPAATQPASCVGVGPNVNCRVVDPTVYRVSSNSSRLGVRGSESLGRGLTAIFQLESNVNADTGGGILGSRETFVGLQGAWGTAKIGIFLAPYDDLHPVFGNTPTLNTSILSTASLWANGTQSKENGGFDARQGNSIRYDSPNVAGFTGSAQFSTRDASGGQAGTAFGSNAEEKRHANIFGASGFYRNGPVVVAVGYEQNNKLRGAQLDDRVFGVAANYNFGVVKVGGVYERLDYDTPSGSLKRDFYGVSATVPLGPGEFFAFYGRAEDGEGGAARGTRIGSASGGVTKGADTSADQWSVSYTYPLSKRTLTYVGYHRINNDANANYSFNINPYPVVNGGNPSGFVGGIVHFF
ncbi:MAG: porin [Casimicrobiaceae bacterium]